MAGSVVTGGAGFIGSRLVAKLAAAGRSVTVVDDLSSGRAENLSGVPGVTMMVGDVRDPDLLRRACAGAESVFHLAALTSVPESVLEPERYFDVNATGTLRTLVAARDAGVRRFVLASSCAVYGDPGRRSSEEHAPAPMSPYAATKLAGEGLCRAFAATTGLEALALRFFNVYGPGQSPDSPYAAVVPKFLAAIVSGRRPVIFGSGEQTRDLVFVDDVARACMLASESRAAVAEGVLNVGTGASVSVKAVLETVCRSLGASPDPAFEPARTGDVLHSGADVSRIAAATGFCAAVTLDLGVDSTARWMKGRFAGKDGLQK